jgi:hypothetical protein
MPADTAIIHQNCGSSKTPAPAPLLDYIARTQVPSNFKAPGCSARAAKAASKYAGKTFVAILEALRERPMTPDEVSKATGINLLTVRPRMSDLLNPRDERGRRLAPFIAKTGIERATDSGKAADVLRVLSEAERAAWTPPIEHFPLTDDTTMGAI